MRIALVTLLISLFLQLTSAGALRAGSLYSFYDRGGRLSSIRNGDCSWVVYSYSEKNEIIRREKLNNSELLEIEISGPTEIHENSYMPYGIKCLFEGGAETFVSNVGEWRTDAPFAVFDPSETGRLNVGAVDSAGIVRITASFETCGVARSADMNLRVVDSDSGGCLTCTGSAARLIRDFRVISCHPSIQDAYQAAMDGDAIQAANADESAMELISSSPKEAALEGYEGSDFTFSTGVVVRDLESRSGTLVFK